jgi:hypothetical protein
VTDDKTREGTDPTPSERELFLADDALEFECRKGPGVNDVAKLLARHRQELLSSPAVVLEAAERLLRAAGVATVRCDGPPHDLRDFVELWTMREWNPDELKRGINAFDADSLPAAFAALVAARSAGDGSSGGG